MDTRIYIGIIEFIVLLLSLSIHESAHAWTSDRLGDPTARNLGRVSLNPVVHADMWGTVLIPLMGIFIGGFLIGWAKPVPVNVGRLRKPTRDHMIVAAAGPLSNLLVAAILFTCLMIMKSASNGGAEMIYDVYASRFTSTSILVPLTAIAYHGVMLNVLLAVFNLLPVAPLDGATVLSGLLPRSLAGAFNQIQSYGFMLLLLLVYMGIPAMLYYPVQDFLLSYLISI
jgi:Zn-dependent protease